MTDDLFAHLDDPSPPTPSRESLATALRRGRRLRLRRQATYAVSTTAVLTFVAVVGIGLSHRGAIGQRHDVDVPLGQTSTTTSSTPSARHPDGHGVQRLVAQPGAATVVLPPPSTSAVTASPAPSPTGCTTSGPATRPTPSSTAGSDSPSPEPTPSTASSEPVPTATPSTPSCPTPTSSPTASASASSSASTTPTPSGSGSASPGPSTSASTSPPASPLPDRAPR